MLNVEAVGRYGARREELAKNSERPLLSERLAL
jgi:hypothetical protein